MTNEELDIIQHATGRNYEPRRERNLYMAGPGSKELAICRDLKQRGFMDGGHEIAMCDNEACFHVTEEGEREYLRLRPPQKRSRGKERYRQFLREDSVLKFGEWLKQLEGRRHDPA